MRHAAKHGLLLADQSLTTVAATSTCTCTCRDPALPPHEADAMVLTSLLQLHSAAQDAAVRRRAGGGGGSSGALLDSPTQAMLNTGSDIFIGGGAGPDMSAALDSLAPLSPSPGFCRSPSPSLRPPSCSSAVLHVVATMYSTDTRAAVQACLGGLAEAAAVAASPSSLELGAGAPVAAAAAAAAAGFSSELIIPEE